ncbi:MULTISPECIES: helix-turn-helix domain-containing protein [unclassified Luteibacter]|uniref:helix-turn-helix domain-containing protein n=1 Tax=Luteibacter sp. PvP019 TaxID=3156436 RepID=UPI0033964FAE
MLRIKLKEAMSSYSARHGRRITYDWLAARTGLSRQTIASLASRPSYDTRLSTIEKICRALECQPGELLELSINPPRLES